MADLFVVLTGYISQVPTYNIIVGLHISAEGYAAHLSDFIFYDIKVQIQ